MHFGLGVSVSLKGIEAFFHRANRFEQAKIMSVCFNRNPRPPEKMLFQFPRIGRERERKSCVGFQQRG